MCYAIAVQSQKNGFCCAGKMIFVSVSATTINWLLLFHSELPAELQAALGLDSIRIAEVQHFITRWNIAFTFLSRS